MNEKLFYIEIGQGKPLVCLHGYALDHTIWLKMSDEMKTSVKLILPDLRGHGRSPSPDGKYSMRTMAEDVLHLMDDQNLENICVAGHSMGGYIALALAEYYPDRLSGLALVASHAFEDLPEKKKARIEDIERIRRSSVKEVLAEMPDRLTRDPEIAGYCKQLISQTSKNGVMGVLEGMAERPDRTDILKAFKKPKVLIAGIDDQLIPLKTSKDMARMIEELMLVEIKGAGHMPMMEKPFETGSAVLGLIKSSKEIV
jgi:pimeloyl-ACP methyl ester carboxylesterase